MSARRAAAIASLVFAAVAVVLVLVGTVQNFPRALSVLACLVVAIAAAWYGVRRRGTRQAIGLAVAALALAGVVALVVFEGDPGMDLSIVACVVASSSTESATTRAPSSPSLSTARWNPRSCALQYGHQAPR